MTGAAAAATGAASLGEGTSRLVWNDTRFDLPQSYKYAYTGAGRTGRDLKRTSFAFGSNWRGRGVKREEGKVRGKYPRAKAISLFLLRTFLLCYTYIHLYL